MSSFILKVGYGKIVFMYSCEAKELRKVAEVKLKGIVYKKKKVEDRKVVFL